MSIHFAIRKSVQGGYAVININSSEPGWKFIAYSSGNTFEKADIQLLGICKKAIYIYSK